METKYEPYGEQWQRDLMAYPISFLQTLGGYALKKKKDEFKKDFILRLAEHLKKQNGN